MYYILTGIWVIFIYAVLIKLSIIVCGAVCPTNLKSNSTKVIVMQTGFKQGEHPNKFFDLFKLLNETKMILES